nr:unnamed protein product [Spodoptera littoralis]
MGTTSIWLVQNKQKVMRTVLELTPGVLELLQNIKKWIQKRQNADGSFTPLAADKEVDYYPVDITKSNGTAKEVDVNEYYYYDKDGNMTQEEIDWERRVEVTAETLVALLEVGVENKLLWLLPFSSGSSEKKASLDGQHPGKMLLIGFEETSRNIKTTSYEAVTMEQYVAGVRVLLAACARGALAEGEAAARFLYYRASTLQRHPSLAYSATKAAAQYAALAHDRHRALTVSLATAGMELTDTLELRARTPPRPLQLPGLPTKVFVYATGAGCATVQGTITYSTYTPKPENALLNIQAAIIEEIRPERSSIEDLQGNLPTLIIKTCFKGESVWFVFANISSTCPVCVTYEVRSKFVITSLRPAFAKIYPSTRPDLAVETFFHARPGSPLLRGITDDDFITWFDKTELASLKTSTSIDNICECGRICSRDYEFRKNYEEHTEGTTENVDTTTEESSTITTTELSTTEDITSTEASTPSSTTEIVTTQDTTTTTDKTTTDNISSIKIESLDDPIIIPTVTYVNTTEKQDVNNDLASLLPKITGELIVPKSVLPRKDDYKKKPLPRRKGTLKATYGDKHEKFFLKLREMENSVSTTTSTPMTSTVTSPTPITTTIEMTSTEKPQQTLNNENHTSSVPVSVETEKSLHKIVLKKTDVLKPLIPVNVVANKTELKTEILKILPEDNMTKVNKTVTVEVKTTELPLHIMTSLL